MHPSPFSLKRRVDLVTATPLVAAGVDVDVAVLNQTVAVLDLALGVGSAPALGEEVEPAAVDAGALEGSAGKVVLSREALAALDVDIDTVIVLGLASLGAGVGCLRSLVRLALTAVDRIVELEGAAAELVLEIVAADQRELNLADGVARAVAVPVGGRLLADVGRLRGNRGDGAGGDGGGGGGSTREDGGGSLGGRTQGTVLVKAVLLVAAAATSAGGGAEALNVVAPLGKVETVKDTGPAGRLEAGSGQLGAGLVGIDTVVLVLEVRDGGGTPVTTLVLALVGNDSGDSAQGSTASGGDAVGVEVGGGGGGNAVGVDVGAAGRR